MITIKKEDIPEFLKNSKLYQTFYTDDIIISQKYNPLPLLDSLDKNKINLNSLEQFEKMLGIIRYWQIDFIPYEIYNFVDMNRGLEYEEIFVEYWNFTAVQELKLLIKYDNIDLMNEIAKRGYIKLFEFKMSKYKQMNGDTQDILKNYCHEMCYNAAVNCNFEMLKYCHEKGCQLFKINEETKEIDLSKSPFKGVHTSDLNCFKYYHENGYTLTSKLSHLLADNNIELLKYFFENGGKFDNNTSIHAVNDLECLKYCHENGCVWSRQTTFAAVVNNNIECLKYAHENGCEWDEELINYCALHNKLECLKYASQNGCKWTTTTSNIAMENNNIECFEYCCANGCPINRDIVKQMIELGHLKCLKYFHENVLNPESKVEKDNELENNTKKEETTEKDISDKKQEFILDDLCLLAVENNKLDCLKFLHKNGYEWDKCVCDLAEKLGYYECLKYACENGCEWFKLSSDNKEGHLKCFKYGYKQLKSIM